MYALLFLQLFASITSPLLLIITHFHYFFMELLRRITTITTITTHFSPGNLLNTIHRDFRGKISKEATADSTGRQPGPAGPGLRCHVTHALRGARVAPGGPAATPPADDGHRDSLGGAGGRDLRSLPVSSPVGPSVRMGAGGGGRVPLRRSRHAVWMAQHQLAMRNRPQAKQVSSNESPVPGVPCPELRSRRPV
jgi:hypothetical protein